MEQNKKLSELSLEELLSGIETDEEQYKDDGKGDFLTFLNEFNIVPGKDEIHLGMLYNIYKAWSKTAIKQKEFTIRIVKLFQKRNTNILIDENEFKLKRVNWEYFAANPNKRSIRHETNKKRFEAFLSYFELTRGNESINFDSIEILYDRYIHKTKRSKFNSKILKSLMKLYFKETITARGSYFMISDSIWKSLNKEVYNAKEKEIKKKRKKIPSTNT